MSANNESIASQFDPANNAAPDSFALSKTKNSSQTGMSRPRNDSCVFDSGTIVIAIATFRRPKGLQRLLDSLARMVTQLNISVLVADNDARRQEGVELVRQINEGGFRWPIAAIVEPQQGISQVRNALMKTALSRSETAAIVMIDDDQWVEPDWLDQLVAMQKQTDATVVGNYVVAEFPGPEPEWATGLYLYGLPRQNDGICEMIYGTGGVLIMKDVSRFVTEPFFDVRYSQTGNGDTEFFTRLKKAGGTSAFSGSAVAHEVIGQTRMTRRWALRRAFRIGQGYTNILRDHGSGRIRFFKAMGVALVAVAVAPLLALRHCFNSRRSMRALLLLFRNLGKITALSRIQVREYTTTIVEQPTTIVE